MMRFLCAERRVRTPARSIDAALLVELYTRNYDYLLIKSVSLPITFQSGKFADGGSFLCPDAKEVQIFRFVAECRWCG